MEGSLGREEQRRNIPGDKSKGRRGKKGWHLVLCKPRCRDGLCLEKHVGAWIASLFCKEKLPEERVDWKGRITTWIGIDTGSLWDGRRCLCSHPRNKDKEEEYIILNFFLNLEKVEDILVREEMKAEEEGLDWLKVAGSQLWLNPMPARKLEKESYLVSKVAKLEKFSTISITIGFETPQVTGAEEAKTGANQDWELASHTLQWDEKARGSG